MLNATRSDYRKIVFHFRFQKADVLTSELDTIMTKGIGEEGDRFQLQDTDFFIIAAGSDTDNTAIATAQLPVTGLVPIRRAKEWAIAPSDIRSS